MSIFQQGLKDLLDDLNHAQALCRWRADLSLELMDSAAGKITDLGLVPLWNETADKINTTIDSICKQRYYKGEYLSDYWGIAPISRFKQGPTTRLEHI